MVIVTPMVTSWPGLITVGDKVRLLALKAAGCVEAIIVKSVKWAKGELIVLLSTSMLNGPSR